MRHRDSISIFTSSCLHLQQSFSDDTWFPMGFSLSFFRACNLSTTLSLRWSQPHMISSCLPAAGLCL